MRGGLLGPDVELRLDIGTRGYFVHPYASWERGLEENAIGPILQCFPNYRDLTTITKHKIEKGTDKLNHRLRQSKGFRMTCEVVFKIQTLLTVTLQG